MKKKMMLISLMSIASVQCFASGSGTAADSFNGFITVVAIVFGILNLILFFKVWGMTNDVRALKKDHFYCTGFKEDVHIANYMRRNILLGNTDRAKRILLQNFIENVEEEMYQLQDKNADRDNNGNIIWRYIEKDNLQKSIVPYVNLLIKQYAKLGEEVPAYILQMKTFEDYFGIFTSNDFIVEE